jgi:hypothetical protein
MISLFNLLYGKHAKVDDSGIKSKPAHSRKKISKPPRRWENIVPSEGEDEI